MVPSRWVHIAAYMSLGLALTCVNAGAQLSFSAPKNVSNNLDQSATPQIAVDAAGKINVVWVDTTPGNWDIFFSRSSDGGATFSVPQNLSSDAADNASPQLSVDAGGNISVVWENDNITFGVFY